MKSPILFLALLLPFLSTQSTAQTAPPTLEDFHIVIKNVDGGVEMSCSEGCAWTNLSFTIQPFRPQAVDEYGMTNLDDPESARNPDLTNFLFTVSKTDDGIALKGIEGTAWKELTFTLLKDDRQVINQDGMMGKK